MVQSALVGQPPLTDNDLWIVKGDLLITGYTSADPTKGLMIPPFRPPLNLYHFESRQSAMVASSSVGIIAMIFFTGARLMVRKFMKDLKFGLDDWLIIPALVLSLLWPILQIVEVKVAGGGKHIYDVSYHELYMQNWLGSFSKMDYFVALGFIKLSITSFNMRITGLSSRKWMYAHWAFFSIITIYMLLTLFLVTFQCIPVVAAWDTIGAAHLKKRPHCYSDYQFTTPLSVAHIVLDFCLLAVPIVVLRKVQLPRAAKIRLYGLFSIGALCCFLAVMRQVSQDHLGSDFLWGYATLVHWSIADLTLSVIVASLPILGSVTILRTKSKISKSKSSNVLSYSGISKPKGTHKSDLLHSRHSQEGIMRQDEFELAVSQRDTANLEEGGSGNDSQDAIYVEQQATPWTAPQAR